MKTFNSINLRQIAASLAVGLACICAPLAAQQQFPNTPLPAQFTDWTGKVDNNFFNPGNWSTGAVPDGANVAIRLSGDPATPNKHIVAKYTGAEDKVIQFFSIQSGANKIYTMEFSGDTNAGGWLIINPVGRGFVHNGIIGTTAELGQSYDITYPTSTGDSTTRLAAYYILNNNTRISFQNSTAGVRQQESGLAQGVFTLNGNAQIDLSKFGDVMYVKDGVVTNPNQNNRAEIGGLLYTSPGSVIYVGGHPVAINTRMAAGSESIMEGTFYTGNTPSVGGGATCHVYGDITRMKGIVNFVEDGRATFHIRSGAQYLVEGVHSGNIRAYSGATIGGSGRINGNIQVDTGGLLTAGQRGSTLGNSPDTPLTIGPRPEALNNFNLDGTLGFDLVSHEVHDRIVLNLSGTMTIRSPATVDSAAVNPTYANLVIGMADSYNRTIRTPVKYDLLTVNLMSITTGTVTTTGTILGDFVLNNVAFPASMSLKSEMGWTTEPHRYDTALQQYVDTHTLYVTIEQMPFASAPELAGKYLVAAARVDEIYSTADEQTYTAYAPLFDALNRQPSIILYNQVLDQLTPSAYQTWFPSAVVRTNALLQSIDDRMYQDAAFKRKKGTWSLFLDGYRQEASRNEDDNAAYSNYGIIGTVVGADYAIGENFVAGGFLSYDKTDFDLDIAGGSSDVNSYTFGLKARYNLKIFQFNMSAFYGTDAYKSTRSVAMTGLGTWATADTDGTRVGAAASIACTLRPKLFELEVTPVVGLQFLNWSADAFQETNAGAANLYVYKQSANSRQLKAGVRIARSFPLKNGFLRPYFHYSLLHEIMSDERTMSADLFGQRIDIAAPATKADGYRIDLGIDWSVTRRLRVELRYQSEYRGAASESVGVRGGVNYTF